MIDSLMSLGEFDATENLCTPANLLSLICLSPVGLPGRELPEGSGVQVYECGTMTVNDYDTILDKGFGVVAQDILLNRFPDKDYPRRMKESLEFIPKAIGMWEEKGIVPFCPVMLAPSYDTVAFARGLPNLMKDIMRIPDKTDAVMKVVTDETVAQCRQMIRAAKPLTVFLGIARGASIMTAPKLFERFVWPGIKKIVDAIVEEGSLCYLHCDSNWERDLDHFLDLPKHKCVMSSDSMTNIYKMKEVLDGHMCLMGDVPAPLFVLSTPDEVFNHCTKLIQEIGPKGYILSQSCTIPANAKPENVAAMLSAASGR